MAHRVFVCLAAVFVAASAATALELQVLDQQLCQVRAVAVCAAKRCATGSGAWSETSGCHVKCGDCGRRTGDATLYFHSEFDNDRCNGTLRGVRAGISGTCGADKTFVSCTKDTCFTHRFSDPGCAGHRQLVDAVATDVCIPSGRGGELYETMAAAAIHPYNGESACPSKDVHKLECALAIAECVAECFGGFEACLECIIGAVGSGDAKICCQTLSHYVGFDCSDCNNLEDKA